MTRLQRAMLTSAAFILATLGATGALVAAGLNEGPSAQRSSTETCVAGCR